MTVSDKAVRGDWSIPIMFSGIAVCGVVALVIVSSSGQQQTPAQSQAANAEVKENLAKSYIAYTSDQLRDCFMHHTDHNCEAEYEAKLSNNPWLVPDAEASSSVSREPTLMDEGFGDPNDPKSDTSKIIQARNAADRGDPNPMDKLAAQRKDPKLRAFAREELGLSK